MIELAGVGDCDKFFKYQGDIKVIDGAGLPMMARFRCAGEAKSVSNPDG